MKRLLFALGAALLLVACVTPPGQRVDASEQHSRWAEVSGVVDSGPQLSSSNLALVDGWSHFRLPGKRPTSFSYVRFDGRDAVAALAESSASMLRQQVRVEPAELGRVRFSWHVPDLIAVADMSQRDADDSSVRVVFAFEGDRSKFSTKNAMLNELTRALTGEEMPYAVLMYVWSKQRPLGSVINSPRTDRIRKLVVESGNAHLSQWLDYERNVAVDFEAVFGEAPGALLGMGIMTDTDNTRTTARAWYGPLQVTRERVPALP